MASRTVPVASGSSHRLRYDDVAGKRSSAGVGDTRLWLRAAPLRWLGSALPFAVRAGFKVPIGDFDVDAEVIPLGDGGRLGRLGYKLAIDGWDGAAGVTEGVGIPSFQRDLVQLQPSLLYDVGSGQIEAGARFALEGKTLPAGITLMFQYFSRWEPL